MLKTAELRIFFDDYKVQIIQKLYTTFFNVTLGNRNHINFRFMTTLK